MSTREVDKKVKKLLKKFPSLQVSEINGSVKCSLSGHEMKCNAETIKSYVNGKKFKKLVERQEKNFEQYQPHLVPSKKKHHENQLFCTLTFSHVNKTLPHVERHVNGRKFKRALANWEDCQRRGVEYKPPRGRRKIQDPDVKQGDQSEGDVVPGRSSDVEEGEESETDSLSDLYPAKDLDDSDADEDTEDKPDVTMETQQREKPKQEKSKRKMKRKEYFKNHQLKKQKVG